MHFLEEIYAVLYQIRGAYLHALNRKLMNAINGSCKIQLTTSDLNIRYSFNHVAMIF